MSISLPFLRYSYSNIWPWKFKVKVMGEVKVESHNMGPTFSRLTSFSFHVNQASHSRVTTFFFLNLTLKINHQGHGGGHSSKSQCGWLGETSYLLTSISFHVNQPSHSCDTASVAVNYRYRRYKIDMKISIDNWYGFFDIDISSF